MFVALFYGLPESVQAQDQTTSDRRATDERIISCSTIVIVIEVTVTDLKGKDITGLRHNDFVVFEDGIRQTIDFWRRIDYTDQNVPCSRHKIGYYPRDFGTDERLRKIKVEVKVKNKRKIKIHINPESYIATTSGIK
jgi:hypothetical protein